MRLFHHAKYPFLEWRRRAYIISGALIVIGVAAMIFNVISIGSWLDYGVDFRGGTMVQVQFAQPTSAEDLRRVNPVWQISTFGDPSQSEYTIRMPSFNEDLGTPGAAALTTMLDQSFGPGSYQVVRTYAVGPSVGVQLQQKALIAILISFALTLVYLAFRFEWRFGVAAVVATVHDIIITLGLLALLRSEISTTTVAAFLTIVGYSLNDTIIVFDRIREDLAKKRRGTSYMEILNGAINETLPRTVLTAGTTLASLAALYLFGGSVIREFAQVLILGIGIGTFSSIFVASPVLYYIENRWPPKEKKPRRSSPARRRQGAAL